MYFSLPASPCSFFHWCKWQKKGGDCLETRGANLSASDRRSKAVLKGFVSGCGSGVRRVSHFSERTHCVSAGCTVSVEPGLQSVCVCLSCVHLRVSGVHPCSIIVAWGYMRPLCAPFSTLFLFCFGSVWRKPRLILYGLCHIFYFNIFQSLSISKKTRTLHINTNVWPQ